MNAAFILVGSPTNPKSTTFSILLSGSVFDLINFLTVIKLASFPETPTALPPASLIAATIDLFIDPANTISTISTVDLSVMRRPSTNSLFMAMRSSISPICGPPPCTTSGLAYKMKGRVGDSPIIGSGLFIDNKIGGAVATGLGEEVVKTVGSFLVVELMRQGLSPQEACEKAVKRIVSNNSQENKFQVAYIAMNKKGEVGSYSIEPGFTYMDYVNGENKEIFSKSEL